MIVKCPRAVERGPGCRMGKGRGQDTGTLQRAARWVAGHSRGASLPFGGVGVVGGKTAREHSSLCMVQEVESK